MNYFGKQFNESREDFVNKQEISLKKSNKSGKDQWSSLATNHVYDPDLDPVYDLIQNNYTNLCLEKIKCCSMCGQC